jgi:hypothetical protein
MAQIHANILVQHCRVESLGGKVRRSRHTELRKMILLGGQHTAIRASATHSFAVVPF